MTIGNLVKICNYSSAARVAAILMAAGVNIVGLNMARNNHPHARPYIFFSVALLAISLVISIIGLKAKERLVVKLAAKNLEVTEESVSIERTRGRSYAVKMGENIHAISLVLEGDSILFTFGPYKKEVEGFLYTSGEGIKPHVFLYSPEWAEFEVKEDVSSETSPSAETAPEEAEPPVPGEAEPPSVEAAPPVSAEISGEVVGTFESEEPSK